MVAEDKAAQGVAEGAAANFDSNSDSGEEVTVESSPAAVPISTRRGSSLIRSDSSLGNLSDGGLSESGVEISDRGRKMTVTQRPDKRNWVDSPSHESYSLMYDMLTGIRVAAMREANRPDMRLIPADYAQTLMLRFTTKGNGDTPAVKYDFKFKDYYPRVFREVRKVFGIDDGEYIVSLTGEYILSELSSPGKSKSIFFFSKDMRYIIKTVSKTEAKAFAAMLPEYYQHCDRYPNTLITRFCGLHRVKSFKGRKMHFVVMCNTFPPGLDIHERWDLKGSTVGRAATAAEKVSKSVILKDLDWLELKRRIRLGPEKARELKQTLAADAKFLDSAGVMDYSLLLGVHHPKETPVTDPRLAVFSPVGLNSPPPNTKRKKKKKKFRKAQERESVRKLMAVGGDSDDDGKVNGAQNARSIFCQDAGGCSETGMDDNLYPGGDIYFLNIIDILQPWNTKKSLENFFKGFKYSRKEISAVNPKFYADRFKDFMCKYVGREEAVAAEEAAAGKKKQMESLSWSNSTPTTPRASPAADPEGAGPPPAAMVTRTDSSSAPTSGLAKVSTNMVQHHQSESESEGELEGDNGKEPWKAPDSPATTAAKRNSVHAVAPLTMAVDDGPNSGVEGGDEADEAPVASLGTIPQESTEKSGNPDPTAGETTEGDATATSSPVTGTMANDSDVSSETSEC